MITIENNGNQIQLFGRNKDKHSYSTTIHNFHPYFYYEDEKGEYDSIDGIKLSKKIVHTPSEVKHQREHYKHHEADVLYTNRYIVDEIKEIPKEPIKICYLDIETLKTEKGYEDPVKANNPISCIGCYDSFDKEQQLFIIGDNVTEIEMLKQFISYIKDKDPDLLIAWNGDGFDFPMIINRIKRLGLNPNELGRGGNVFVNEMKGRVKSKCYGRVLFDLMWAYRKMSQGGRESWSLDYISKYEGVGQKEEYKGELDDLFYNDREKFILYNKVDVDLLVILDEKLRIVDFFDEVRRMCFCKFEDVFMQSKTIDCLCLKYAKDNNFVLPSVRKHDKEKYKGGFVANSEPKLHKNIACMDYKSLYPAIILAMNISPETLLKKQEEGCLNCFNKYFFSHKKAIIPGIVKPLLEKRKEFKLLRDEAKKKYGKDSREFKTYHISQLSLKILVNAVYGITAFRSFRLFKKEIAEAITYIAREINGVAKTWFEKQGHKVIYQDTDSIFIEMYDKTIEDISKLNNEYNKYFHNYLKQFGTKEEDDVFELEFEKVYKTIFFKGKSSGKGVKKKYAGITKWKDGENIEEFSITGFESRRSDSPQVGRDLIKQVLKMICLEKTKEVIDEYVNEFRNKLRNEYTPEQLALPIGLSKSLSGYKNKPIHVRAALLANELHKAQIQGGDKIKYIYVKGLNNVIAFKTDKMLWSGYKVDYDMMERRICDMKIQPLYTSLGWEYPNPIIFNHQKKKKIIRFEDKFNQKELW